MLTALFIAQLDDFPLAERSALREISGVLGVVDNPAGIVRFRLEPWKPAFAYQAKAGAFADVRAALQAGALATVAVDGSTFVDNPDERVDIYALSIDGRPIRTFDEIANARRENNNFLYLLIAVFALATLALAVTAVVKYRRVGSAHHE